MELLFFQVRSVKYNIHFLDFKENEVKATCRPPCSILEIIGIKSAIERFISDKTISRDRYNDGETGLNNDLKGV